MNTFVTTREVRDEAWLSNNQDILDTKINTYRERAYAMVYSAIASIYNVPTMMSSATRDGSSAKSVLQQAELLFAAGYLLTKEYGVDQMGYENDDGVMKINDAKSILGNIASAKIRLFWSDGLEFDRIGTNVSGPVSSKPREARNFTSSNQRR